MTGSTTIDAMMIVFTLVGVLGLLAIGWRVMTEAPRWLLARRDAEVAARTGAMAVLADAHARAADGPARDALARNYRFHRDAVRALDPSFVDTAEPVREPIKRAA